MKRHNLAVLALVGIATALAPVQANETFLAQATDQYICATYNNCGACGGKCNLKNPETPGLTPEQKKTAEEYQKSHPQKKKEKKEQPAAPQQEPSKAGEEKCGAFCNDSENNLSFSSQRNSMQEKRNNLF